MKSASVFRIRLISVAVAFTVLMLLTKLWMLQIVSGDDFRIRAERQYLHPKDSVWNRGTIFFKTKDGSLVAAASLKTGFTFAINPKALLLPEEAFKKINTVFPIARDTFLAKAAEKNLLYAVIAKRVPEEIARKIAALELPGALLYKDRFRYYPSGALASNALGLVGYKGDDLAGRYGLENYYEDTLRREPDGAYSNFFAEIFSSVKKTLDPKARFGGDIVTSLEPTIESFLENELRAIEEKWRGRLSGGIVMDPKTGEIYAMANHPSFNPNDLEKENNPAVFSNPIVESVYEMGSIIKPLTMASGLDSGAVDAETTYNDRGSLTLNGRTISNFDGKGRGVVTMQAVLDESLNTGAAFVAREMGNDLFSEYFLRFGLGEETGVDLPNETPGIIGNLKSPRELEHATASFGQGIAMSPMIAVRALAALGNGGYLVTPHLATEIQYRSGASKRISYPKGEQVIKPETSEEITRMLVKVVDDALLGGTVRIPNYTVAAKTGTAQIAKGEGGGYYSDKYLHSFFGYFPAYNPRFIIFLYMVEPKGVGGDFASHTLTEPFMNIVKFLINYYKIPPDR